MPLPLHLSDIDTYRTQIIDRIRSRHIRTNPGHKGRLFLISTAYPGYWLEHLYDSIVWAKLFPEYHDLPVSQIRLFLEHQREDGRIPAYILDNEILARNPDLCQAYIGSRTCAPGLTVRYDQLQECVSVASLCLEAWEQDQSADLSWYYTCCCKWDEWLYRNRMTRGTGLVETFCGFDTGHDNSDRFEKMKYPFGPCSTRSNMPDGYPVDCDVAPIISPDVNAVFYGNRIALAKMADKLGRSAEAAVWRDRAATVKQHLFDLCFDPESLFFYDLDKHNRHIPVKSISITSLFCEHVLDHDLADRIFTRYLENPQEFGTPYAFPGISIRDPKWLPVQKGNDWGYYAQGNVALRTTRWMEYYGKEKQMLNMMAAWLSAWCRPGILHFGQELHPLTGEPSECSEWYSTTMLYLLYAMQRMESLHSPR